MQAAAAFIPFLIHDPGPDPLPPIDQKRLAAKGIDRKEIRTAIYPGATIIGQERIIRQR
jgi:hypothetical protein